MLQSNPSRNPPFLVWLSFATEQRQTPLSTEELDAVPGAFCDVLDWLDSLAVTLVQHRDTPEYQTARRKSGDTHGATGLTATEHGTRTPIRRAKLDMVKAKSLAAEWEKEKLTYYD